MRWRKRSKLRSARPSRLDAIPTWPDVIGAVVAAGMTTPTKIGMTLNMASIPQRTRFAPEAKLSTTKCLKIGKSSLQLADTTHQDLSDLAAVLHCTMPDAARYVLDASTSSLLQMHLQLLRMFSESFGATLSKFNDLLSECVTETGMNADDAFALWSLRGLQRGHSLGWRDISAEFEAAPRDERRAG